MPSRRLTVALLVVSALGFASPARADITAFLGAGTNPSSRLAKGLALGTGLLVVGFEFEYSDIAQDEAEGSPGIRTGQLNVLAQTPVPIAGIQFYATAGGGIYRERLADLAETHVLANVGGGAKVGLIGPIRLRLDYRLFKLRGDPINATYHRVYAGLNLGF